jgi:hypothetical protein
MAVIMPANPETATLQNPTTQTAIPAAEVKTPPTSPRILTKRIGGTTFQVAVHFSTTSKETMSDKISRLIRNEAVSGFGKAAGQ